LHSTVRGIHDNLYLEELATPVRESEMVTLSNNWRAGTQTDQARYAKATTPVAEPPPLTVEEEAQGLARRIRASNGGERQHNLAVLNSELRTLNRNIENGYPDPMWQFRINVIRRTFELVGSF
jgi:hypothetical protein